MKIFSFHVLTSDFFVKFIPCLVVGVHVKLVKLEFKQRLDSQRTTHEFDLYARFNY